MSIQNEIKSGSIQSEEKNLQDSRKAFNNIINLYLESNPVLKENGVDKEFEIRFGSNIKLAKDISKIDYDNVVKTLYSCGFKPDIVIYGKGIGNGYAISCILGKKKYREIKSPYYIYGYHII